MYKANNLSFDNGSQTVHKQSTIYKATVVPSNSRITLLIAVLMGSILLSGCAAKYKSSWSCKNPEGIGCSNIYYADLIARKHIILNDAKELERASQNKKHSSKKRKSKKSKQNNSKKVLIREHYSDFEKIDTQEVEID